MIRNIWPKISTAACSKLKKFQMFVLGSESRNEVKKTGGKKAGKSEAPTTAKSQDKKGEKKVCYNSD